MYLGLLLILLPLALGYLVRVTSDTALTIINRSCSYMIYVILFLMGMSLSLLDNLANNALIIIGYSAMFSVATLGVNLIGLFWLDRRDSVNGLSSHKVSINKLSMVLESLQLLGVVLLGFVAGMATQALVGVNKIWIDSASEWALMLLLGLIGCQLRNSGIALREILLNKQGMLIALMVMVTSWVGGIVTSIALALPLTTGLAISSGFGWYSLSGILISDGLSPVLGGVAFISDLVRELVAILLIPLMIKRYRHCAIGVSGATAMDFTLPIIQKSGGSAAVPLAIVSGFILTLASPLFILVFINLS